MSVPPEVERRGKPREMPFFPQFLLRDLLGWVVALGVLAALAALFPWELGEKADPFAPAFADIKPEWYFMFMFETLKIVPGGETLGLENEALAILGFGALALVAFLVPFLDRGRGGRGVLHAALGVLALVYVVGMTAYGYRAWWPVIATALLVVVPWVLGRSVRRRQA